MSGSKIQLNEEYCIGVLKKCFDSGYKTGLMPISEGAKINKLFRILKKTEDNTENLSKTSIYELLFRLIEQFNKNKAYTFDETPIIHAVMSYIIDNILDKNTDESNTTEVKEL